MTDAGDFTRMPQTDPITVIFPVAGTDADKDFRGFETADGECFVHRSLRSFRPFLHRIDKIIYIVLEEHAQRFDIAHRLAEALPDVRFELVMLASPTRGPAETVARGVAKQGINGPAIICDIDHRLDPAPLFDAIDAKTGSRCLISLWPLKGEELKRWSVACTSHDNQIVEVAERRLPGAAGAFFGVIGCYYFEDVRAVMDSCLEQATSRFSDYFNRLASTQTPARGVRLVTAEFFGDEERIRQLEKAPAKFRGTIFCDIDGTLLVHEDKPDYSRLPTLLPGSREKLHAWISEGYYVVLCTARKKEDEVKLAQMLGELNIPYHQMVTGLASGARIVINDRKPYEMFTTQASSLEITRNQGIAALEILPDRRPTILRRFEGGSFAETFLVEDKGKCFVRKRATKECNLAVGYGRLRNQYRNLERFAQIDPELVPGLLGEENNSHEYFYDMEFLSEHIQLSECEVPFRAAALDRLLSRFDTTLYSHRNASPDMIEDWFQHHLQSKIFSKIETLSCHERLRPFLSGDDVIINGMAYPTLERLLAQLRQDSVGAKFKPRFLSLVHGDLTFQNIMVRADGDTKIIDMEAQDSLEAVELDMGKLLQSTNSQYEIWSQIRTPLCRNASARDVAFAFQPQTPDLILQDVIRRRWAKILGCSHDEVDMKGEFYLSLHLIRMIPFRMRVSVDQALYAMATALITLQSALAKASATTATGRPSRKTASAAWR